VISAHDSTLSPNVYIYLCLIIVMCVCVPCLEEPVGTACGLLVGDNTGALEEDLVASAAVYMLDYRGFSCEYYAVVCASFNYDQDDAHPRGRELEVRTE